MLKIKDLEISKESAVTQHNTLIRASYFLSLTEQRIIILAIAKARKENIPLDTETYIQISADEYQKCFPVEKKASYKALKLASENLFDRRFSFRRINENQKEQKVVSRWIQSASYIEDEGKLEILFTFEVLPYITQLAQKNFTTYKVGEISDLSSFYAIRLYEYFSSWKNVGKTPVISVEELRELLGVEKDKYNRMDHFKSRILEPSIKQIKETTSIKPSYQQFKKGRTIIGFEFTLSVEKKTYQRKRISIEEALKISQEIEGGYPLESEKDAIRRVMEYKNEDGNSVFLVDSSPEKWAEYRRKREKGIEKREEDSRKRKPITIGNIRIDEEYIYSNMKEGEDRDKARERLVREAKESLESSLEDTRTLPEILGFK